MLAVRVRGIEPPTQRWKRRILPLNYTRIFYFSTMSMAALIRLARRTPCRLFPRALTRKWAVP